MLFSWFRAAQVNYQSALAALQRNTRGAQDVQLEPRDASRRRQVRRYVRSRMERLLSHLARQC